MTNQPVEFFNTVVIGGGPAGMMAAIKASEGGNSVCIVEKNDRLGKKLRITGKGRCNVTNDCDFEELLENIPENGKFLYSSLSRFSNKDIINYFNDRGCPTVTERGKRVFPASFKSVDIVNVLKKDIEKQKIKIFYGADTEKILTEENHISGVSLKDGRQFRCENIVIATGGMSYPLTGSTGDGYRFAKELGHTVTDLKPALIRLVSNDKSIRSLAGLTLKNISVVFSNDCAKQSKNSIIYDDFGELLFTGDGISGPVVLSASSHLLKYDYNNITAHIDLKPALTVEKLNERVSRDFYESSRKQFKNSLSGLLPKAMIDPIVERSGISPEKFVNQITKEERSKLVDVLKDFTVKITGSGPMDEAIVTSGGVKINEIDPRTMESKLCKNLYFAGEIIDVAGYTGGFNLTIAFSTGYMAGCAIKEKRQKYET
ncbi:MAG: NAD(P)/FAD-dependent oxidoreductase [Clostridia bacterium]|nr:NAD(P)/FAD-dependent oxidoreductase [Clostridia bacterium]